MRRLRETHNAKLESLSSKSPAEQTERETHGGQTETAEYWDTVFVFLAKIVLTAFWVRMSENAKVMKHIR